MEIQDASTDWAGEITDQWVDLATDQRAYNAHILPEQNRSTVRDAVLRHVVADELLVAVDGDRLLGFVMFTVEAGDYEQDVQRGIVRNIYVKEGHRGHGVGSQLLEAAESRLRERGVDTIALEVMATNEDARRFYRRHGYSSHRLELEKSTENDTL
jgi:ribosomal protein S18 acetylase RimI-like enzyme